MGVQLVRRGNSAETLATTPAGFRFARHGRVLLATAEAAKHAAHGESGTAYRIRLGIPAGPVQFLRQLDLGGIVRQLRSGYPELLLSCRHVPFPALTTALLDNEIDVLCTVAPVRHPAVVSTRLPVTVGRVGVVRRRHELADAATVDVTDFAQLPILYDPRIPDEWMSVFYLGDVRTRKEAHLVAGSADSMGEVMREAAGKDVALVAPDMFAPMIGTDYRPLVLAGARDRAFYAAHRRSERRGAVMDLVSELSQPRIRHRLTQER